MFKGLRMSFENTKFEAENDIPNGKGDSKQA